MQREDKIWTRRAFIAACGVGLGAAVMPELAHASRSSCAATDDNIEGPYYRAGAPFRSNLVDLRVSGAPLLVMGRVLAADCRRAIAGALLDVWQADGAGHYDNDGTAGAPRLQVFRLRGRLRSGSDGRYRFQTVVPGHYLNGDRYRPAHIHVKLSAAGCLPLTTQLYFPDDRYNDGDPFIKPALVMPIERERDGERRARFDFVLSASR